MKLQKNNNQEKYKKHGNRAIKNRGIKSDKKSN